jgi:hypothetical protein
MKSSDLLDALRNDSATIDAIFQEYFLTLTDNQLNWKPSAKSWSISECLEHIILSGQFYVEEIQKQFVKFIPEREPLDIDFHSGILGNFLAKSMKPGQKGKIRFKMKTMKRMEPGKSDINIRKLFNDFQVYQTNILSVIEKSRYYNINTIKVNSSIGRILKFKLGNALRFVVAHNQRHIQQAINVIQHEDFPK